MTRTITACPDCREAFVYERFSKPRIYCIPCATARQAAKAPRKNARKLIRYAGFDPTENQFWENAQ